MIRSIFRKVIGIVLILGIGFAIWSGISWLMSENFTQMRTDSTDLSGEMIKGVELGGSIHDSEFIEEYEEKYKDDFTLREVEDEAYDYYALEGAIEVATEKDTKRVAKILVRDPAVPTARNIGIGNTKLQVIKAYGNDYYEKEYLGWDTVCYIDKNRGIVIKFILGIHDVGANIVGQYDIEYVDDKGFNPLNR